MCICLLHRQLTKHHGVLYGRHKYHIGGNALDKIYIKSIGVDLVNLTDDQYCLSAKYITCIFIALRLHDLCFFFILVAYKDLANIWHIFCVGIQCAQITHGFMEIVYDVHQCRGVVLAMPSVCIISVILILQLTQLLLQYYVKKIRIKPSLKRRHGYNMTAFKWRRYYLWRAIELRALYHIPYIAS